MPIKFRCPGCRQAYSISSKKAGTSLRCQKCDAKMRIPSLNPETAPEEKASSSSSEPREKESLPQKPARPVNDEPDLAAAMQNLLDDDDNIGNDDFVDLSADELPASATTSEPTDDQQDDVVAETTEPAQAAQDSDPESAADDEDELAAVLAFEQSLEEGGAPTSRPPAPLPDELFAEEDDEDEEGFGRGRGGEDEEMDLTPMVDVTFLLLVFFMITASFSIQKTLEVPPPNPEQEGASQSQKLEDIEEKSVEVHIDSRNVISVDDEPLSDPTRLADVMRSKRMNEVLITAHENSMHDMLTKVVDAANEIGMQKIRVGITKGID